MYVPSMGIGCGLISHVSDPIHIKKFGKMFGFWGRDNGEVDRKSIFVMEHFYKNTKVMRYKTMANFVDGTDPKMVNLPSQWAGTGHLVLERNVYFNRFNTSTVVQVGTIFLTQKIPKNQNFKKKIVLKNFRVKKLKILC